MYQQFLMGIACCLSLIEIIQPTHGHVSKNHLGVSRPFQEMILMSTNLIGFMMPANRTYHVFLFERGTKLSLVSQVIMQPQPSFTLKHDTQLLISKTIRKTSEAMCQNILASERMTCIRDKVEDKIVSTELSCLPFQYTNVFSTLNSRFPSCKDNPDLSSKNINVIITTHL